MSLLKGLSVAVEGQVVPPCQGTGPPDMIRVFMGQDDRVQAPGVYPNQTHASFDLPAAQPGINENPGVLGLNVAGVSPAARRKDGKFQGLFHLMPLWPKPPSPLRVESSLSV